MSGTRLAGWAVAILLAALVLHLAGCFAPLFPKVEPVGPVTVFVADSGNAVVRRLACSGMIQTLAGIGESGCSGNGGPAAEARLGLPVGLAANELEAVYIADIVCHVVRRVATTGLIATAADTGAPGYSGDGGPAWAAALDTPTGVALDPEGNLYIYDSGNHRIRRVDRTGTIRTFAGTGTPGYSGDGGPALLAELAGPGLLWAGRSGELYFTDMANHVLRRVSTAGVVTTVAGTGVAGYSGDGGAAAAAQLSSPTGVWASPRGGVWIADSGNHRVRLVSNSGTITTVAGTGTAGYSGDGGPATLAELDEPVGVWGTTASGVLSADSGNARVRRVGPDGRIETIAGDGFEGPGRHDPWPATLVSLDTPYGVVAVPSAECRVNPDPLPTGP